MIQSDTNSGSDNGFQSSSGVSGLDHFVHQGLSVQLGGKRKKATPKKSYSGTYHVGSNHIQQSKLLLPHTEDDEHDDNIPLKNLLTPPINHNDSPSPVKKRKQH